MTAGQPPEPPIGSEVVDVHGVRWEHVEGTHGGHYWMRTDSPDGDPESWHRVLEFGPVLLAWSVTDLATGQVGEELRPLAWVDPQRFISGFRPPQRPR